MRPITEARARGVWGRLPDEAPSWAPREGSGWRKRAVPVPAKEIRRRPKDRTGEGVGALFRARTSHRAEASWTPADRSRGRAAAPEPDAADFAAARNVSRNTTWFRGSRQGRAFRLSGSPRGRLRGAELSSVRAVLAEGRAPWAWQGPGLVRSRNSGNRDACRPVLSCRGATVSVIAIETEKRASAMQRDGFHVAASELGGDREQPGNQWQ